MGKKCRVLAIITIMLFVVFGLTACDNISLDEYKVTKSQELQDYAEAIGQENHFTAGWEAICKAVTDGKKAIEDAATRPVVDTAFNDAKDVIDAVEREDKGLQAESESDKPLHPIWLGFTTDRSIIAVGDDLTVRLYYAPRTSYDIHNPKPVVLLAKIITKRVVFGERKPFSIGYFGETIEFTTLKNIDDFTDSTKFPVAGSTSVAFETITIPADYFVGDRGVFVWGVSVDLEWTYQNPTHESGAIGLYYRVFDDYIVLFSRYDCFLNYEDN